MSWCGFRRPDRRLWRVVVATTRRRSVRRDPAVGDIPTPINRCRFGGESVAFGCDAVDGYDTVKARLSRLLTNWTAGALVNQSLISSQTATSSASSAAGWMKGDVRRGLLKPTAGDHPGGTSRCVFHSASVAQGALAILGQLVAGAAAALTRPCPRAWPPRRCGRASR